MSEWLFLTNQARVLLYISRYPASTARKIAQAVGITERATQRLIRDLDEAGFITRKRVGRHNEYVIHRDRTISGDVVGDVPVSALLDCLGAGEAKPNIPHRHIPQMEEQVVH
jgi:DNA-binding Lrp family transcriptional regulator